MFEGAGRKEISARSRKKCYGAVKNDIQHMGIRDWTERAKDSKKQKHTVKNIEAGVHKACSVVLHITISTKTLVTASKVGLELVGKVAPWIPHLWQ